MPIAQETVDGFRDYLAAQSPGLKSVEVMLGLLHRPSPTLGQIGLKVKSVIAVGAGKGGVGKEHAGCVDGNSAAAVRSQGRLDGC